MSGLVGNSRRHVLSCRGSVAKKIQRNRYGGYFSHLMTKPTKWHVHLVKTKISLGSHPVWSESSLSAWRKLGSLATHWAHSKDSYRTGRMPRLIWVFAGRTGHFVGFVMRRLNYGPYLMVINGRFSSVFHKKHEPYHEKPVFGVLPPGKKQACLATETN